jgi:hypothetical protein
MIYPLDADKIIKEIGLETFNQKTYSLFKALVESVNTYYKEGKKNALLGPKTTKSHNDKDDITPNIIEKVIKQGNYKFKDDEAIIKFISAFLELANDAYKQGEEDGYLLILKGVNYARK